MRISYSLVRVVCAVGKSLVFNERGKGEQLECSGVLLKALVRISRTQCNMLEDTAKLRMLGLDWSGGGSRTSRGHERLFVKIPSS